MSENKKELNRFDYVKYDDLAQANQNHLKTMCMILEEEINNRIKSVRAKDLALQKLEEFYMWVGKGIRDDQVERNKSFDLQEERTES